MDVYLIMEASVIAKLKYFTWCLKIKELKF